MMQTRECQQCGENRPDVGFTSLGLSNDRYIDLCPTCMYKFDANRLGITDCGPLEFEPIRCVDADRKERHFLVYPRLALQAMLEAVEIRDDEEGGHIIRVTGDADTPPAALYGKLVSQVRARVNIRYLRPSEFYGGDAVDIQGSAVNGRIEDASADPPTPCLVIDGRQFTWEQLGQALRTFSGFEFRIEMFEPGDDVSIEPDPMERRFRESGLQPDG